MATPNESLVTQNLPDTPEQAQERALLRAENEQRAHERDLVSINTMLDANPSKETIERILRKIVEKMPEERTNLERMSVGADIQVLEVIARNDPSNPEVATLLQKRKERHQKLSKAPTGTDVPESPKTNTMAHSKPKESISSNQAEYPPGTKILSVAEVRKMEQTGKTALERKFERSEESSPEAKLLWQKIGQANLLLSTWEAYRDYLVSIEAGIRFKNLSDKPRRYQDQIRAIESTLMRISGIAGLPEVERIKELGKLDIASLANTVFVAETNLSTAGWMNQPMLEVDAETHEVHGSLNVSNTLAETENRYQRMRGLITEPGDWSEASAKKRKYEILTLLRQNDSRDDDPTKLNSGEAIAKQSEKDVLKSPGLRKNERIKQDFDTVLKLQNDPKAQSEFKAIFFGASTPTARQVDIFFQGHWVELPKESLESVVKKGIEYRKTTNTIIEKERDKLASAVDKPGMFPKEFVAEFKKDPEGTTRKALYESFGNSLMSFANREVITNAMKSDLALVRGVRSSDPALKLYTNIEGVTHTSDETVNERISNTEVFTEQVLIMYASGFVWGQAVGFARGIAGAREATALTSVFESGAASVVRGKRALAFAGETAIDGGVFAVSYSTLSGLSEHGYIDKKTSTALSEIIKDSNTWDSNLRIVAFLGVMKAMMPVFAKVPNPQDVVGKILAREFPELAVKIGESPIASKGLQLSRSAVQWIENITLDTTALLGTDTVIRGLRGEDLPKNTDEIPNYLMQEFKAIIKYVVALRWMSGELFHWTLPPNITKEANAQIIVNLERNGDIAIRTLEGRVVVIKKELQTLDYRHNRLVTGGRKSHGEKQEIAQAKRDKKEELKDAVSDVEEIQRVVSDIHGQNTQKLVDSDALTLSRDTLLAGVGANAKKELQANAEEWVTAKTGTNHTANNLKSLEIDPRNITLSETMSGFSSSLDTVAIGKKFSELLSGMKNIESPELLQKQAETVIQGELQAKYDAMMKDYDKFTPEAQQAMDTWRESMEWQARELTNDFRNALRTKLEGGRMNEKWGNPEYLNKMMARFVDKMSPSLKQSMGTKKDVKESQEEKMKE